MRKMPARMLASLDGSRGGEYLVGHAWRGGNLVAPNLDITDWTLTDDRTRQVRTSVRLTIADPTGMLAPWDYADELGCGGSTVWLTYVSAELKEQMVLGEFIIVAPDPTTSWTFHDPTPPKSDAESLPTRMLPFGRIELTLEDLTRRGQEALIYTPVKPTSASALAEIRNLWAGLLPVRISSAVADVTLPDTWTHQDNVLAATNKLTDRLRATYRVSPEGILDILPGTPNTDPVWTVTMGLNGRLTSEIKFPMKREDIVNEVVVIGQAPDGSATLGQAQVLAGPLAMNGPCGRLGEKIDMPLAASNAMAQQIADQVLQARTRLRTTTIPLGATPHPGLQSDDVIAVQTPYGTLGTPISDLTLSGNSDGPAEMSLNVLSYPDDMRVLRQVARSR